MTSLLTTGDFIAIAAVDNERILSACLKRSPDIELGRLPLVTIRNARSMSCAYNEGLRSVRARVAILAHQDVYLPRGWLDRATIALNQLAVQDPSWRVAGPYGVTSDGTHIGRVWDVTLGRELGEVGFGPTRVESFDELLMFLNLDTAFSFDEELPHFHLYGTDLVQTAISEGRGAWAIETPVVHNNRPISSLRGGYALAYRYAKKKWYHKLPIETSICTLSKSPVPLWHAQIKRRHITARPSELLADAVVVAKDAGYE